MKNLLKSGLLALGICVSIVSCDPPTAKLKQSPVDSGKTTIDTADKQVDTAKKDAVTTKADTTKKDTAKKP